MKKSIRRIGAAAAAVATLLGVIHMSPASAGQVEATGRFRVIRGDTIVNPEGNAFIPRGVNLGGLEYYPEGVGLYQWNFDGIKSWGANTIRLPVSPHFAIRGMCTYDNQYLLRIDQAVAWAQKRKMLLIIDDHFSTKGQTCGAGKRWATGWPMPDVHNLNFIKMLGQRYKNKPYVAIDLYNEPHHVDYDMWRNGGINEGVRVIGMQQMLDALRSTGFTGLAVVSGTSYSTDMRDAAVRPLRGDYNVIYGAHMYPYQCGSETIPKETPYECKGQPYSPTLDAWVGPMHKKRALMLSEFGTQRPVDREMRSMIQWAENRGIGWTAWLWCAGPVDNYCLTQPHTSFKPSTVGLPVQDYLRLSNGWPILR